MLKAENVRRLLVDNTVLAHGVTHETAWGDTGKKPWVNLEVDTGYTARIPVHAEHDSSDAVRSVLHHTRDLSRHILEIERCPPIYYQLSSLQRIFLSTI